MSQDPPVIDPIHLPAEPSALRHGPSHLRLWIAAIGGLVADLWTKQWAFDTLNFDETRPLISKIVTLQLSLNPGALFGIGAGWAPLFVGASVLALMFVLYLFAGSSPKRWTLHFALGFVLAGAVGNLYDRTTQTAYVVNDPQRGRDIGTLVEEREKHVVLSDFGKPDSHRRMHIKPTDTKSGPQPVVRDFIKIELAAGGYSLWPWIFNIADALLVVGVGVLLINFWTEQGPDDARAATPDAAKAV